MRVPYSWLRETVRAGAPDWDAAPADLEAALIRIGHEVEDVVAGCPGVLECAAVGIPDDKSGEAVKLVVVKKDAALTEARIRDYCKANLTGYKQPKTIEFRAELPKTPVGKILRRELRDKR